MVKLLKCLSARQETLHQFYPATFLRGIAYEENQSEGKRTETGRLRATESFEVSRVSVRKQSLIYRYFKPKEKPRAATIPRNAAPLNEGEIELFQLIRLNRHEEIQHGGAIAARPPSTSYSSRERHDSPRTPPVPFDLSSFGFTLDDPGGGAKYRANFIAAARLHSALVLFYAVYTRTSVYPTF